MNIPFRSVPILAAESVRQGSATVSTTQFDMSDVRSHTLEVGFFQLAFFTKPFWVALFIWAGILLLLWDMTGKNMLIFSICGLASLVFVLWGAYSISEDGAMERLARVERKLPKKSEIKVVKENSWQHFLSRLQ